MCKCYFWQSSSWILFSHCDAGIMALAQDKENGFKRPAEKQRLCGHRGTSVRPRHVQRSHYSERYFCEHMNNTDIVALQTSPVLFSVSTYQPTRLRHTFMHLQLHLADAFIKSNVHGKKNIHTHNKYCSTFFRLGKQAGAVVYNFKH